MVISNYARSWILLIPLIPSILVSIFNLYHFLSNRTLRTALNNHAIILLLICGLFLEFTDIPWQINYYRTGTVSFSRPAFCFTWVFSSSAIYISVYLLMAWTSIERHILIFYPNLVGTKTRRFFFHYFPLAISILYPMIFYLIIFFILPCNIPINYNGRLCNLYNCVLTNFVMALWDSIGHFIMSAFIIVIFSVTLFVRVLYNRYRIRQRIEWRNYKKMALQLLPISALYILLQLPPMILYAAYSAGLSPNIAADYFGDSLLFTIWVILFTPFACALSLPDLGTKCRNVILFWQRSGAVGPTVLMRTHSKNGQTGAVVPTTR
jgi:hypothetical protein